MYTLKRDYRGASLRCCALGTESRRAHNPLHTAAHSTARYNSRPYRCSTYHGQVRIDDCFGAARSECPPVLSALRVFALSGKRWLLSVLVFVVASVPAITNLVSRVPCSGTPGSFTDVGERGCQVAFNFSLTGVKVFTLGCIEQLDVTPLQHKMYVV